MSNFFVREATFVEDKVTIRSGTVITKPVKPYALVVGNPGRQIGWVSAAGIRLEFNGSTIATCPETKVKYKLDQDRVAPL